MDNLKNLMKTFAEIEHKISNERRNPYIEHVTVVKTQL